MRISNNDKLKENVKDYFHALSVELYGKIDTEIIYDDQCVSPNIVIEVGFIYNAGLSVKIKELKWIVCEKERLSPILSEILQKTKQFASHNIIFYTNVDKTDVEEFRSLKCKICDYIIEHKGCIADNAKLNCSEFYTIDNFKKYYTKRIPKLANYE